MTALRDPLASPPAESQSSDLRLYSKVTAKSAHLPVMQGIKDGHVTAEALISALAERGLGGGTIRSTLIDLINLGWLFRTGSTSGKARHFVYSIAPGIDLDALTAQVADGGEISVAASNRRTPQPVVNPARQLPIFEPRRTHIDVLAVLYSGEPKTTQELTVATGMADSSIVGLGRDLLAQGWVTKGRVGRLNQYKIADRLPADLVRQIQERITARGGEIPVTRATPPTPPALAVLPGVSPVPLVSPAPKAMPPRRMSRPPEAVARPVVSPAEVFPESGTPSATPKMTAEVPPVTSAPIQPPTPTPAPVAPVSAPASPALDTLPPFNKTWPLEMQAAWLNAASLAHQQATQNGSAG